jgi:glycosyltransferase involved in cell wall biosynthesis
MAAKRDSAARKHVLLVATDASSVARNRRELLAAITALGHRVTVMLPAEEAARPAALSELAVAVSPVPDAVRLGPVTLPPSRLKRRLCEAIRACDPDIVIAATGWLMAPALRAASTVGVACIMAHFTRLDRELLGIGRGLAWPGRRRLGEALAGANGVILHNEADLGALRSSGLLPADIGIVVVPGGGVDLERFAETALPPLAGGLTFAMIARHEERTGALVFCEAAQQVKARSPSSRFVLAGPDGSGSRAIGRERLAAFAGVVDVLCDLDDVRPTLAKAHVVVLPSRREGMARILLEALAIGRPLIVSSVPGCRETVDERVNGVVVPPDDAEALAAAMESYLRRPDLMPAMARASRLKAERRFDVREVNAALLGFLDLGREG